MGQDILDSFRSQEPGLGTVEEEEPQLTPGNKLGRGGLLWGP